MGDLISSLGFNPSLAAHATASIPLFVLVYRFMVGFAPVSPKIEKLLAALVVAIVNVLAELARGDQAQLDHAMFSSTLVGAFVAMLINDAVWKKKIPS